jgi:hypothetical protein
VKRSALVWQGGHPEEEEKIGVWASYVNGCCFWQGSQKWVTCEWCFLTSAFIHVGKELASPGVRDSSLSPACKGLRGCWH